MYISISPNFKQSTTIHKQLRARTFKNVIEPKELNLKTNMQKIKWTTFILHAPSQSIHKPRTSPTFLKSMNFTNDSLAEIFYKTGTHLLETFLLSTALRPYRNIDLAEPLEDLESRSPFLKYLFYLLKILEML